MASRRRKKNPLLIRILVVSIAAHAVALPIAAHFGAFQKLEKKFGTSQVVVFNTPPIVEKKSVEKAKPKPSKPHAEAKKSTSETKHAESAPKSNLTQPKLLAGAPGGSEGGGPTVDPNGTGKAGELPKEISPGPTTPPAGGSADKGNAPPTTDKAPITSPPPPTVPTAPIAPRTVAPVAKKFVQVETDYAPDPVIPDDLRTQPLDATTVVEADVDTNGHPENIRVAQSSGTKELDNLGVDTAKKYRFKPAKLGDDAVEGHVRFRIVFKVE